MLPVARLIASCAIGALMLLTWPAPGQADAPPLRLSGDLTGLVPGQHSALPVRVENTSAVPVTLLGVDVTATAVGTACPDGALTLSPWRGAVEVAPGATYVAVVTAVVSPVVSEGCGSWDLTYVAR